VRSILDKQASIGRLRKRPPANGVPILHPNIRGPRYYPLRRMPLLTHPMLDQLGQPWLVRHGPRHFAELEASDENRHAHSWPNWLGLLVDRELTQSPRQAACRPTALCQIAPAGQPSRTFDYRAPRRPRPPLYSTSSTDGEWIRHARQSDFVRADRRGQILACLCPGSQGLPRQPFRSSISGFPKLFPPNSRLRPVVTGRYGRILRRVSPASNSSSSTIGASTRSTRRRPS